MSPTPEFFDAILLAASVGLFISSMMSARWRFFYEQGLYDQEHLPKAA